MRDAQRSASLVADPAHFNVGSMSDPPPMGTAKARWDAVLSADGRRIHRTYVPAQTQGYAAAAVQPPPHLGAAEQAAYQVAVWQSESPETLDVRTQQRILQQANAARVAPTRPAGFRLDVMSEAARSVGDPHQQTGPYQGYPYPRWQMHQWAGYPPAYADPRHYAELYRSRSCTASISRR